jgi:hypothetical protein
MRMDPFTQERHSTKKLQNETQKTESKEASAASKAGYRVNDKQRDCPRKECDDSEAHEREEA